MKKLLKALYLVAAILIALPLAAADTESASALARRIMPEFADRIVFEHIDSPDSNDIFEIEQNGDNIVIRGNSANAMATGLGHYLKYYCLSSVSWYAADPVELPEVMPAVPEKVSRKARVHQRFFLNYCTFGYTMPWWQWKEWERFIDWMALQGINLPLAITGQEAVWEKVWQRMGLDPTETRAYFTGPAHLPWNRMSNLDSFQGELPQSWLTHQAELQKQIVARERELGMKPVLPAFSGHVPEALAKKYPDANITRKSQWCGFRDCFRSFFLDPMDPLFPEIQKAFLEEQTKLYGTDHIYGIDPFNEVDPPSWEPADLAKMGSYLHKTLADADPEATWLQMTWLFYQAKKKWHPERIKAYITSIPAEHCLLLDYYCDKTEVWKETEAYHGMPYLWCYLGNFGGNTMLVGNLTETGERIENVMKNGGDNFCGLGSTLEALDVNPMMYEYVFEKAWDGGKSDDEWIDAWADRRAGKSDSAARRAWAGLHKHVYNTPSRLGQATLTNSRPSLEGNGTRWTKPAIKYDNAVLFDIWQDLIASANKDARDAQVFDIVNVGRQVLGNHFSTLRSDFTKAYKEGNLAAARAKGNEMIALLDDMETLLSSHNTFLFGRWLDEAEAFAADDSEKEYYRKNARTLLSTWGERDNYLNDYANRGWAGLMKGYYKPRWQMFVDDVTAAMERGEPFDEDSFKEKVMDFEQSFVDNPYSCPAVASPGAVALAASLADKYRTSITGK